MTSISTEARPFMALPAVVRLNEIVRADGCSQRLLGEQIGCAQPTVSDVLSGKTRFGALRRAACRRVFGIALEDWLTPEERGEGDHGANNGSQSDAPQDGQLSSGQESIGTAPESMGDS